MAIDLYANFERTRNSNVFYRNTSFGFYPVTLRLIDLENPTTNYSTTYYAESSLNGAPFSTFHQTVNGRFEGFLLFNSSVPALCSVRVNLKDVTNTNLIETYEIGCRFVSDMPIANFALWPTYVPYRDPSTNLVTTKVLNGLNFTESSGTSFFGEGHTETFYLSCWNITVNLDSIWFVGTPSSILINKSRSPVDLGTGDSVLPIASGPFLNSGIATITSAPLEYAELPVSLFIYDNINITPNSPVVTYHDATGEPFYYPFFYSTQDINGDPNPQNTYLRDTIRIIPYTSPSAVGFNSDLNVPFLFLPINSTNRTLTSEFVIPPQLLHTPVTISYKGSEWNTMARSFAGNWGDVDDAFTNTGFLPMVNIHNFSLKYDSNNNGILDYFTASPSTDTTVTVSGTATRTLHINTLPYDWIPRNVHDISNVATTIKPLPFGNKIYTPNYYNLKNTDVRLEFLINFEQARYIIKQITFSSNSAIASHTSNLSNVGTLNFNKTGLVSVLVTITTEDTVDGTLQTYQTYFPNFMEVVDYYDDIKPDYYYSKLASLNLSQSDCPKLSPNEWGTSGAINSVVSKFYDALETINQFGYEYVPAYCFYGWLGLVHDRQMVWQEIECPPANQNIVMWMALECELESCRSALVDYSFKTWESNECPDPNTCSGAYCAIWNWKNQKGTFSDQCIKWKDAICETDDTEGGKYGASWKNNTPCDTDSEINCVKSTWHICTIDPEYFPVTNCDQVSFRCSFVGIVANHNPVDTLVLAYSTELHLVSTDYGMTKLDLRKLSNQTTQFQNIVGASIGPFNQLFVLDATLSQVSVFRFTTENKLELINNWGKFGFKDSVNGINKPRDIHADQNNNVLIADTGNKCVKKFAFNGRNLGTLTHSQFENDPPRSSCVDSEERIHVLISRSVLVFDYEGNYLFQYALADDIKSAIKINANPTREAVYITYGTGVVKYFKNGTFAHFITNNHKCENGTIVSSITTVSSDKYRNLYVTAGERIFKFGDRMKIKQLKSDNSNFTTWTDKHSLLLEKNEYIQPWVYLKLFHRLWDNIEIIRSSLFYQTGECKSYKPAIWEKEHLIIGQNEIVSNAVVNRLICQLWDNLQTVLEYFNPTCGTRETLDAQLETCCKNRLTCDIIILEASQEIIPDVEKTCDRLVKFEGNVSYPHVETFELGVMSFGLVNLITTPYTVPDRYILNYNNQVVVDTGYLGQASRYGFGSFNRNSFTNRLSGLSDPITGNIYPFASPAHEPDNYPKVLDAAGLSTFQFNKNTLTSTLILSVYAPMVNTLWDAYISCPGQQEIAPPTPTPTPVVVPCSLNASIGRIGASNTPPIPTGDWAFIEQPSLNTSTGTMSATVGALTFQLLSGSNVAVTTLSLTGFRSRLYNLTSGSEYPLTWTAFNNTDTTLITITADGMHTFQLSATEPTGLVFNEMIEYVTLFELSGNNCFGFTPTPTPTATPTPTPTATPTPTPTATPTPTPTPIPLGYEYNNPDFTLEI